MGTFTDRVKGAWNAFNNEEKQREDHSLYSDHGPALAVSQAGPRRFTGGMGDRSVIASIYTRLGIDIASVAIRHVDVDENNWYQKDRKSGLNECLTVSANIDQAASAFRQDMVQSLFDSGVLAIVPVDTYGDPNDEAFDVITMRVGIISQWYPRHVKVEVYNDKRGLRQEVTLHKSAVGIVHNPLYDVMNESNSTLKRLIRKINLLDYVDEQAGSGKLDLILQLPYTIRSESKKEQATKRRKDLEDQLANTKYGVAYADATEKIHQLNRPVENNLLAQVEYLSARLYSELGLTESVFDGTADEQTMLNYHNRTVEPILRAITEEMTRKFLTKTARSQKQAITFFREPFKLVSVGNIAEIADKFTRNEIMTSNEIRGAIGMRPSKDPKADELRNSNLSQPNEGPEQPPPPKPDDGQSKGNQNGT